MYVSVYAERQDSTTNRRATSAAFPILLVSYEFLFLNFHASKLILGVFVIYNFYFYCLKLQFNLFINLFSTRNFVFYLFFIACLC